MRKALPLLIPVLVSLLAVVGCSDDPSAPAGTTASPQIEGEIGSADFELKVGNASRNGRSMEGPFVLRGRNFQYVDSLAALVGDLTVRNDGSVSHPEPVTLTFVDLIPSSVTLLNPDNGINGDGAAINFSFANGDAMWTPGEESLPRTVHFSVGSGVSIGFVGQLNVGQPAGTGTIGGLVWNDANQDGMINEGEEGIPGVPIRLSSFAAAASDDDEDDDDGDDDEDDDEDDDGDDDEDDDEDEDDDDDDNGNNGPRTVFTGADGRFAFENVPAGAYVVTKLPSTDSGMTPTTPTQIHVLLTVSGDDVADFLDANFGCFVMP